MMLAKHMHLHLRLEAANEGKAGLGVRQVGDAGVEVEKAFHVGVDVACLVDVSQGGEEMVCILVVGVPARGRPMWRGSPVWLLAKLRLKG